MEYISKIQIKPFKMKVIRNKTKFQILHKFSSFNSQNTHGFLKTKEKKKKPFLWTPISSAYQGVIES